MLARLRPLRNIRPAHGSWSVRHGRYKDFNQQIITEFRENSGRVGGRFKGTPLLLLHTTGAKSGLERVNPVLYRSVEDGFAVFASKAGAPVNPDWYHNLRANTHVQIEVGDRTIDVVARVADADERKDVWEQQKSEYPAFADYEDNTDREIPVIILSPQS